MLFVTFYLRHCAVLACLSFLSACENSQECRVRDHVHLLQSVSKCHFLIQSQVEEYLETK
jgi:hypothetical protein